MLLPILAVEWWDGYDVVDVLIDLEDEFEVELGGLELDIDDTKKFI